jgi:hypothetical protein
MNNRLPLSRKEKLLILGGTPNDEPIAFVVATKGKKVDAPIEDTVSMQFGSQDSDIVDYMLVASSPWLPCKFHQISLFGNRIPDPKSDGSNAFFLQYSWNLVQLLLQHRKEDYIRMSLRALVK